MTLVILGGLLTAAAIFVYTGRANSVSVIGRMFNRVAAESGVRIKPAVQYARGSRRVLDVYAPVLNPKLRMPPGQSPIVLFLYGGSWQSGDRGLYRFVGTSLAKRGITVVIPDYRLYPDVKFPKFIEDVTEAYKWIWLNLARQKKGPPRPIIVMGHSAGANMAALMTFDPAYFEKRNNELAKTNAEMPPPAAFIGLAGPYAFEPLQTDSVKVVFQGMKDPNQARPIMFAKNKGPPTLLFHGSQDETVKISNMRDFAAAIEAAGTSVERYELSGLGHMGLVTAIAKPLRWRAPVLNTVVNFLEKNKLMLIKKPGKPQAPEAVKAPAVPAP